MTSGFARKGCLTCPFDLPAVVDVCRPWSLSRGPNADQRYGPPTMNMTLFRSAYLAEPYFGVGSFWVTKRRHAEAYRLWAIAERLYPDPGAIYRAALQIDESVCADFRPQPVPLAGMWARSVRAGNRIAGYEWLRFFEQPAEELNVHQGPYAGELWEVFVFIGDGTVPAAPVSA